MTIFYVFKIILLNEHFSCRQLGVLLAFGCQLASGKGCLCQASNHQFKEAKMFFLGIEVPSRKFSVEVLTQGLMKDMISAELRMASSDTTLQKETGSRGQRVVTKATGTASWASSRGTFLSSRPHSPSPFLSTSGSALRAKPWPFCGLCSACPHSPLSRLGLAA